MSASTTMTRESAIIKGVERGLIDAAAGHVTSHADVTAEARRIIAEARQRIVARP